MPRGKGQPRYSCYCRQCRRDFKARREDAVTCSARCRKARNRLLGGGDGDRARAAAVTDPPSVFRVLLDGRHVASYGSRAEAEAAIAGWMREWDGTFTVRAVPQKRDRRPT